MDYSTVSNDSEHLAGSSPWAQSSPKANRTSFTPTTNEEVPASPIPQQPAFAPQDGSPVDPKYGQISTTLPNQNPNFQSPDDDIMSPDLSERLQSAQIGDSDYDGVNPSYRHHTHQHHQQGQHDGPQQQRSTAGRYPPHRVPRQVPAYKLQAKVTGLERTGRKDPVVKFDVYVCYRCLFSANY